MTRNLLLLAIGAVFGAKGVTFANRHEDGESVIVISSRDIQEKLDGKDAGVTSFSSSSGASRNRPATDKLLDCHLP